jgi:outer membrane immunogenic protein
MKKILIGALLAGVATSALAADLPTSKPAPAPMYAPPPIFTWTGFYLGANGFYGFGDTRGPGSSAFGSPTGGMGGVTAGYNYQIGQFVTGLEGDFDFGDVSKNQSVDAAGSFSKYHVSDFATVRGRVGFALDRALIYVTGGYAGGEVRGSLYDATVPAYFSNSTWQSGYVVGAGLEYAFTNNISAKAEYLYSQLGEKAYFAPDALYSNRSGLDISMVRVGINYRF